MHGIGVEMMLFRLGGWFLLLAMLAFQNQTASALVCSTSRNHVDRPDDSQEPQIHVMYVVPKDIPDMKLDSDGSLCDSVIAANDWLSRQTSGKVLRFDTYQGQIDITFVRLKEKGSTLKKQGRFLVRRLERILQSRGLLAPHKIYAVFYDGESEGACGGSAFPPSQPGQVSALYLQGNGTDGETCTRGWPRTRGRPAYWDFALLHGVFHVLGLVASCAPHYRSNGHVSDDPRDLMYGGSKPWDPQFLDYGEDDYFRHGRSRCLDLMASPFLVDRESWPSAPKHKQWSIPDLRTQRRVTLGQYPIKAEPE